MPLSSENKIFFVFDKQLTIDLLPRQNIVVIKHNGRNDIHPYLG